MKKTFFTILSVLLLSCVAAGVMSCSEKRTGWTISGNIANACDSTLFIEEPSGATWIIVDSIRTDKDGNFSYQAVYPVYDRQAVYRLRLGDRAAYFPVEGAEALEFTAVNADMDKVHHLSGSAAAEGFNTVDSLVNAAVARVGANAALNDSTLLAQLADVIVNDTTCIVGYYIINRPIEDKFIFRSNDKKKVGLIGAVATRYSTLRPSDLRGQELAALFNNARNAGRKGSHGASVEAVIAGRPDVDFVGKDENGKEHDMNSILDRGGVTVVNFIRYDDALSAANTAALGEAYDAYKNRGLEIFQIGFDPNEAHWRQNAVSMPWITVYGMPEQSPDILIAYNVNPLDGGPVSFVFNADGELVQRITNPAELKDALNKLF